MDYAQLGLSVAQTAKMSEMASELGRLAKAAEVKERQAERVRKLRRAILSTGELLDSLEADSSGTESSLPKQLVVLHQTEEMLKKAGVLPPAGFDEWEDMERASKLGKRIEVFRARLLKTMTDEQRHDAERCVAYMAEEPDLKRWIMVCEATDQQATRNRKVAQIEEEIRKTFSATPLLRAILAIGNMGWWIAAVAFCVATLGGCELLPISQSVGATACLLLLSPLVVAIGRYFVLKVTGKTEAFRRIKTLKGELATLRGESSEEEDESTVETIHRMAGQPIDSNSLAKKFGGEKSVEQLRAMYVERQNFITTSIGNKSAA